LDFQRDEDHNRLVVTALGEAQPLKEAMLESSGVAIAAIDMRTHRGQHPRMGAVDVIPFIPVQNAGMDDAVRLSQEVGQALAERYQIPVFLYEKSATRPERKDLAAIRKGEFEGLAKKLKNPVWKPDFGPDVVHPTAGVTAVGARMPLIAYNVNLGTNRLEFANEIARKVRHITGGFRYCKAIGVDLKKQGIVQVSMNLTDYTQTSIYRVFELIQIEARRYGVEIVGSEIVGLTPMAPLVDAASYYLRLENFSINQVLESRLME
jgi:glutamate formiminotransferase